MATRTKLKSANTGPTVRSGYNPKPTVNVTSRKPVGMGRKVGGNAESFDVVEISPPEIGSAGNDSGSDRIKLEIQKGREWISGHWRVGTNLSSVGYVGVFLNVLIYSIILYFGTNMLRGYNPHPFSFAFGIAFLRFSISILSYSETKGLIDPFLSLLGMAIGRIPPIYGLVLLLAQICGSAIGIGVVHAFNPSSVFVFYDGAPIIGSAWIRYGYGLPLAFEFFATWIVYAAVLWGFGLHSIHCFFKRLAKMSLLGQFNDDQRNILMTWQNHAKHMSNLVPGKLGGSLLVGSLYGVVSAIGFSITGAGLDFFSFFWAAIYSGLFASGYPNWWIYLVGPIFAFIGAFLFWWGSLRLLFARYETMKSRMLSHHTYVFELIKNGSTNQDTVKLNL